MAFVISTSPVAGASPRRKPAGSGTQMQQIWKSEVPGISVCVFDASEIGRAFSVAENTGGWPEVDEAVRAGLTLARGHFHGTVGVDTHALWLTYRDAVGTLYGLAAHTVIFRFAHRRWFVDAEAAHFDAALDVRILTLADHAGRADADTGRFARHYVDFRVALVGLDAFARVDFGETC